MGARYCRLWASRPLLVKRSHWVRAIRSQISLDHWGDLRVRVELVGARHDSPAHCSWCDSFDASQRGQLQFDASQTPMLAAEVNIPATAGSLNAAWLNAIAAAGLAAKSVSQPTSANAAPIASNPASI